MKKYESEALQVIHEDMQGMYELGIINKIEMEKFDELCLLQKTPANENLVGVKIFEPLNTSQSL
jgi:DNA-binding transcriptional regulator YiaG